MIDSGELLEERKVAMTAEAGSNEHVKSGIPPISQ